MRIQSPVKTTEETYVLPGSVRGLGGQETARFLTGANGRQQPKVPDFWPHQLLTT